MSILRMASFKASYALFLKLVSGAILTIVMSASAMVGDALVCLRIGTTDLRTTDLLRGRRPFTRRMSADFWHTTCQNVKLPIFSAFPPLTVPCHLRCWHTKCHSSPIQRRLEQAA